jgi:hypothetical protein
MVAGRLVDEQRERHQPRLVHVVLLLFGGPPAAGKGSPPRDRRSAGRNLPTSAHALHLFARRTCRTGTTLVNPRGRTAGVGKGVGDLAEGRRIERLSDDRIPVDSARRSP